MSLGAGSAQSAGYDNKFFIQSEDGSFRLNIKGLLQSRYIGNWRDGASEDFEGGFQTMRANLFLSGTIGNPKFSYLFVLAQSHTTGGVSVESAWGKYQATEDVSVKFGRFRNLAFMREEKTSYTKQLAVERSYMNEEFTVDYVEGIELFWTPSETVHITGGFNDGIRSSKTDFTADTTDFAVTGRADVKLAGSWKQFADFNSWSSDDTGALVGAAVHYQAGKSGSSTGDVLTWTVDASVEGGGANLYASVVGREVSNDTTSDLSQMGLLVQGGYMVIPDKVEVFGRYELIDYDGFSDMGATTALAEDTVNIATAGVNYYMAKHSAKATFDVQYVMDPVSISRTHTGVLASSNDNQVIARLQLQLMF